MVDEYKSLLKENRISGKDMAEKLNMSHGSYRAALVSGSKIRRWVKAFMIGYQLGKKSS